MGRSDDSFRRMGGAFRIAVNIGIAMNALCMLAMLREAPRLAVVPIFAVLVLACVLLFNSVERNRLKK